MNDYQALFEQVALYLGAPWKYNHLTENSFNRYEVIDGSGRELFFVKDWKHPRFKLHGKFPCRYCLTCKAIGFSAERPPKDIAADIMRRFMPRYLIAYEKALIEFTRRRNEEKRINEIALCVAKVTQGSVDGHFKGSAQRHVYFSSGKAEIYGLSDSIALTLNNLSPEAAIKIAALFHSLTQEPHKNEVNA